MKNPIQSNNVSTIYRDGRVVAVVGYCPRIVTWEALKK